MHINFLELSVEGIEGSRKWGKERKKEAQIAILCCIHSTILLIQECVCPHPWALTLERTIFQSQVQSVWSSQNIYSSSSNSHAFSANSQEQHDMCHCLNTFDVLRQATDGKHGGRHIKKWHLTRCQASATCHQTLPPGTGLWAWHHISWGHPSARARIGMTCVTYVHV